MVLVLPAHATSRRIDHPRSDFRLAVEPCIFQLCRGLSDPITDSAGELLLPIVAVERSRGSKLLDARRESDHGGARCGSSQIVLHLQNEQIQLRAVPLRHLLLRPDQCRRHVRRFSMGNIGWW